jgi:hypothetical protein
MDTDKLEEEFIEETARRLAAVYGSMKMGLSLEYYYRTYVKGKPVGSYWVKMAIDLWDDRKGEDN